MSSLALLPRPVLFGAYGGIAALVLALPFGELVWWLFRPPPPVEAEARPAAHTPPPAPPDNTRLALAVSPKVSVYPAGTNTVAVRVARERYGGPVAVRFDPVAGLTGSDLLLN